MRQLTDLLVFKARKKLVVAAVCVGCGVAVTACGSDTGPVTGTGATAGSGTAGSSGSSSGGTFTAGGAAGTFGVAGSGGLSGGAGMSTTGGSGGAGSGGAGGGSGGAAGSGSAPVGLIWPNDVSSKNSDPWLSAHHNEIQEIHPRFLVIDFANAVTLDAVKARWDRQKALMQEGSRYHGYSDPSAKPFVNPEIFKLVDLTDPGATKDVPYPNSSKMPRRAVPQKTGPDHYTIKYSDLFTQQYADYYAIPDPKNPAHNMKLCELFQAGMVNDIFLVVNKRGVDDGMPEITEYKQMYDDNDVVRPGQFTQNAGNGYMDASDIPLVKECGRSVRVGFLEMTGTFGNSMQVNGHNYEHFSAAVPHFGAMFKPFANFDMDTRYGTQYSDWYGICGPSSNPCITYPDQNSVTFIDRMNQKTINPFNQGCGNAHFPPNAKTNYDQTETQVVLSTCEHYGMHDGPGGKDIQTPYSRATLKKWESDKTHYEGAGPTGDAWYMYWYESWPGLNNKAKMPDGTPMKNWWVYLYY